MLKQRIEIIENFLLERLKDKSIVDNIVKTTDEALLSTNGNAPIETILKEDLTKGRQLERKFAKQIGVPRSGAINLMGDQMGTSPKKEYLTVIFFYFSG